jgi:DNA (cytosine-5)-methyltransferase 1
MRSPAPRRLQPEAVGGTDVSSRRMVTPDTSEETCKGPQDLFNGARALFGSGGNVGGSGKKLRAIDLYSGVGGWSLGLRLAGIEVVASYERWGPANETNFKNNLHQAQIVDIRRLSLADLPKKIDIVVGSPPCTQFSFSNRGGGGDIADGLEDIIRFLTIVDHLKPRLWAMENVPRLAGIMEKELQRGGALAKFRHLGCVVHVVNMADYGLPQRRRRCIAGNINYKRLESYRASQSARTLGDVVSALNDDPVIDPNFGIKIQRQALVDHVEEDVLNSEEVRINRANKTTHIVYNRMPFPDSLDRGVRTITAVCTRVSRESIVIETPGTKGAYRRLTLRERASLQGFPVTFQFYGTSFSQKHRMIGNAVPPSFAYLVGQALRGVAAKNLVPLTDAAKKLAAPTPTPAETPPDRAGLTYPANRTFRFAIPSLQLKSGVRFELRNDFVRSMARWRIPWLSPLALSSVSLCFRTSVDKTIITPWRLVAADPLTTGPPLMLQATSGRSHLSSQARTKASRESNESGSRGNISGLYVSV